MTYRYFISYVYTDGRGVGHAWSDMTMPPIRTGQDIEALNKWLADNNHPGCSVTVTGWQRFED